MKQKQKVSDLFVQFLKFGCFTFGGGWSIVAQMQKTYVEQQHSLTNEELLDLTSVGRSLPGTMVGNVAMLFGYHMAGVLGGVACLFGMILPPAVLLAIITHFYTIFQNNHWVAAAMTGVRAAVVPIMVSAAFNLLRGAFRYPPCVVVAFLTFGLYLFLGVSCVWLVVIGAVCGIAMSEYYERRGAGHDLT
jgi:chromate transporter